MVQGLDDVKALTVFVLLRVNYTRRIDMREVKFRFLRQLFCIPDPVTGFAGTCGFVVSKMSV
jgi:hypothetical protein